MRVSLAMFGFGNVGRAFAGVMCTKADMLMAMYGLELCLVSVTDSSGAAVCSDGLNPQVLLEVKKDKGCVSAYPKFGFPGMQPLDALRSAPADILIEASPTCIWDGQPAISHVKEAFSLGMHVASANKGPIALAYQELMSLAAEKGLSLKFAAAVGAPLPALELGEYSLQGCTINGIEAILNATSNCILDYMECGKGNFDAGLKEAQSCGVAEANPALDVEGWDTTAKMVILTNALMGPASVAQVERRGIDTVTTEMVDEARREGKSIKLLGSARRLADGSIDLKVVPTALDEDHPLFKVSGMRKGIVIDTDLDGRLTTIGEVSDPTSTAAAVLRDVVNIARFSMARELSPC
jgi:homoserine dehydrogenase